MEIVTHKKLIENQEEMKEQSQMLGAEIRVKYDLGAEHDQEFQVSGSGLTTKPVPYQKTETASSVDHFLEKGHRIEA